jgi:hypothetical protein
VSVTGPGCAACNFKGTVPWSADRPHHLKPCDACGGFSQFVRAAVEHRGIPVANTRGEVAGYAGRGVAPETDWRPLPSCAEVLAHNARLGGNFTSSPWLCVSDPSDLHADVRVVWLAIGRDDRVMCVGGSPDPTADPDVRVRPITRRGEALPWPEVPR